MNAHDQSVVRWRKSSRSTNTGGNCVEVAGLPGMIAVRDSKNPNGPSLTLGRRAFRTLLTQLKTDAINL